MNIAERNEKPRIREITDLQDYFKHLRPGPLIEEIERVCLRV
jgi:hypothetical protein